MQLQEGQSGNTVRHGSHLKVKVHRVGSDMHRVQKLHIISLVMWTCQNGLGLNLCVVSPISHIVAISENGLVRSIRRGVKHIAINTRDLASTLVNYQASKLQYNYQSHIQIDIIGDVQGFSDKAPITLSGGFSVETLTG